MLIATKYKRVMLYPADPRQITTVIPTAEVITYQGKQVVAVPHRIDEVRVLNNMGFKVPSPISFYHEWKAPFEAFEAQRITAGMLTLNPRAYVLSELGTGKTQALLWAADYLMKVGVINRCLILCTLSTTERAWGDELFRGFTGRRAVVLHGTPQRRMKLLAQDAHFYILNHHGLKVAGMVQALQERPDIDLVIIDEIAVFRNSRSDLYKALEKVLTGETKKGVRRFVPKPWVWGATAKPTPTEPTDAWAQCRLVTPGTVPMFFKQFRDLVMMKMGPFKWVARVHAADTVAAAMVPAVRFLRSQCYDMKEPIYETRHAEMSVEQCRVYNELRSELVAEYEAGQITAVNEAVKVGKLVQIASGVVYGTLHEEIQIPCPDRLTVLRELIDEATAKVIIFAPFRCTLHMLKPWLDEFRTVGVIDGTVAKKDRDLIFQQFQNRQHGMDTLLAQPGTMAHGLTLTAADMIIWFAPLDNNEIYEQANGRFTRFDQTAQPIVAHIEASPAERVVYNRLKNHQGFQNVVLEMLQTELDLNYETA